MKYAQHRDRVGVNDYCAVNNQDPPVYACKTDRALHCFTWMIVKHNEAANFRALPRTSGCPRAYAFVSKRVHGEKQKRIFTWKKEKEIGTIARNVSAVDH